jgi:hypothetical protein
MKNTPDSNDEARARIGAGASPGAVSVASPTALFSDSSWRQVYRRGRGRRSGCGRRIASRSQVPRFLWIEYPKNVAKRLSFSGLAVILAIIGAKAGNISPAAIR